MNLLRHLVVRAAVLGAAMTTLAALPAAAASPADDIQAVCGTPAAGHARCFAEIRTGERSGHGVRAADALPAGYGPADLRSAYNLPATGGSNQTVAIVDAGDDAHAEADLAVYRQTYGLPACTTANGCFRKVNQAGQAGPLPTDQGWSVEISLDLDMVSASCPACHILLVEGDSASFADLAAAENTAAGLGATEISNSYGGIENGRALAYASAYAHPGVAVVVSSGDGGFGVPNFPAVLTSVTAVGGTSLTKAGNPRGWTESAWQGAGSGCSAWVDKPSWQHDPDCPGRTVADVAADADPNTGVAVYATADVLQGGWLVAGGTSASAPFIAGVIALAGNPGRFGDGSTLYGRGTGLNDVTSGNNVASPVNGIPTGPDCDGDYLCNAGPGYDGPTGNGTPNGISAF